MMALSPSSAASPFESRPDDLPDRISRLRSSKSPKQTTVLSVSRFRNQKFKFAECWDLLNQRWTQVVSEKDTGGMITVMQVDLPNGCKQLAHVHCGLHEAFYKLDNNGHAIWGSAFEGGWQEVSPVKGDFSYASMGTGHGYTNADVEGCDGNANVQGYTATSFTSHFVIKMPGYEHETRARTVPTDYDNATKSCDMMANPIEEGYSQNAKDAIALYGKTDPKFIPALVTLEKEKTYAPSQDHVKPIQYTRSDDLSVEIMNTNNYKQYGETRSVRRLMSLDDWKASTTGTGGVAQMDEIKFSGKAKKLAKSPLGTDLVILLVEGEAEFVTELGHKKPVPKRTGFVIQAENTAKYGLDCKSNECTILELWTGKDFAESYMHDAGYGVPYATKITDSTADYVKNPWGPSKNTYQRCRAPNDPSLAPGYVDFTEANKPTGAQDRKVPFSCMMTCVSENGFGGQAISDCEAKYPKQTIIQTSDACQELLTSPFD